MSVSMALQRRTAFPSAQAASCSSSRRVVCMSSNAKFFVGGNWKCNGTLSSVKSLVENLNSASVPQDVDVVCAPTLVHLDMVRQSLRPPFQVSAQNCSANGAGAFTGETCPEMLTDMEVPWVILGHSERRSSCGPESNELVGTKVANALAAGLKVIACIGETLEQREAGDLEKVLSAQVDAIVANVSDWSKVVIAYEPVWAIGTGVVASPDQAQEVHAFLRAKLAKDISAGTADATRIIYGGSVSAGNCDELSTQEDIDGFLVGGASLSGPDFAKICNASGR